jgi:hypothetical protein
MADSVPATVFTRTESDMVGSMGAKRMAKHVHNSFADRPQFYFGLETGLLTAGAVFQKSRCNIRRGTPKAISEVNLNRRSIQRTSFLNLPALKV